MRFLSKRLMHGSLLLVAVSVFSFLLLELAPGDSFESTNFHAKSLGSPPSLRHGPITTGALRSLGAIFGQGRPWLLFFLQQSGGAASRYSSAKHTLANDDGNASCMGAGPSAGRMGGR